MGEFVCKLGTGGGEILERTFTADSEDVLREQMEQQGYYIFGIKRKFQPVDIARSVLSPRRRIVSHKEFLVFNQEFAALIHAGLPLLQSLDLLMNRVDNPRFGSILQDVYDKVKGGSSLSDAFSAHPDVFPPVYTAAILSGEKSATLEAVIRRYLNYVKIVLAIRTKVISSLIYPLLLLGLSCGVIGILVGYVIPKFSEFYKGFAEDMPWITQLLVSSALTVRHNGIWMIPALLAIILLIRFYVRTSANAARVADRLKLKLPLVGGMWSKFCVSQLMRTLSTLLAGGIPLVNSIQVAAGAVGNSLIGEQMSLVGQSVKEGAPLWISLQKIGLMPAMAIEMVKVGEETGSLEEMLRNVSDFYDQEIEINLANVLAIVEPLMLITMGLIIAVILLAMYYPLFTVYTTIR
ncbi:MAG TPA: type II secretion system F family protein [Acidobacteriota bacterium]|nr:type II secretion system F family protein [Acidobacteriota bacterium]